MEGAGTFTGGEQGVLPREQRSMAMGYVPSDFAHAGTLIDVEINGEMYAARIVDEALYDSSGTKMRG